MIKNKYLRQAQNILPNYYTYLKDKNVLVVAEDRMILPFAFILTDENVPNTLLVAFAIDFPNATTAAELVLNLRKITHITLMEEYYISKSGITYWGDEANKYFTLETHLALENLEPLSKDRH